MLDKNEHEAKEKIRSVIAEALKVPLADITPELTFGDLPQWDSMGHMEVMLRLEENFGVDINADTIAELISVPIIFQYLSNNHLVS